MMYGRGVERELPFIQIYPRLYNNSLKKDAKVGELGTWNNGKWEWKLEWRRG